MHEEFASPFADPRDDPEFACDQAVWGMSKGSTPRGSGYVPRDRRSHRRFQVRIWVVSLVLIAFWAGLLLDPMVGPVLVGVLMAFGLTLVVLLGTMGLGMMGSGLFAAGDHVLAWLRQGTSWPEE
jgi:hypothetical protein